MFRSYITLDAHAFNNNIAFLKQAISGKYLAPVIKSNAYGHGMIQIARLCQQNSLIDAVCVANLSEAYVIQQAGFLKPIIILSTIDADIDPTRIHNLIFMIHDVSTASLLNDIAQRLHTTIIAHIKVDTGLSRLGIWYQTAKEEIIKIHALPHIRITGIASHFSTAGWSDTAPALEQIQRFTFVLQELHVLGLRYQYVHFSNTAALLTLPLSCANLFRTGIGMYGLWPSAYVRDICHQKYPAVPLQPILSWHAPIILIKDIPAGEYIGYERTYIAMRPTRIALIPCGYFDGFDVRLSNNAMVKIRNYYAPIIGRVSMNVLTIDITDIAAVQVGDMVTLIGNDSRINLYARALETQTPNLRALLCNIDTSIERRIISPTDTTYVTNTRETGSNLLPM